MRTLVGCFIVALFFGCSQGLAQERPAERPVVLPNATQLDLQAKSGETYRIFLSLPAGEEPATGRPVIYLSDANGNFPIVATLARRRSPSGGGAVVVGIGYPTEDRKEQSERRSYDLTPKANDEWLKTQPAPRQNAKSGGNDLFLDFIEHEVKPLVESRVKVDKSQQMLFGHSFGGLLVLHALFTRPESFQYYAASSPSIWWNDRSILQEEEAFTKNYSGKKLAAKLWLTVGEFEQPSNRGNEDQNARLDRLRQAANSLELMERLNKASITDFECTYALLEGEDHGSAVFPAANRAIRLFAPVGSNR